MKKIYSTDNHIESGLSFQPQLHDLSTDVYEQKNIVSENKKLVNKLEKKSGNYSKQ